MILVAGEALIDRMVDEDGRVQESPGGGPYNVARTLARLGSDVAFLGRLSSDPRGQRVRAALVEDGVDLRWASATDDPTTLAIATIGPTGDASYVFELAGTSAAGLTAAGVQAALASGPDAIQVGTLGLVMEPIASAIAAGLSAIDDRPLLMVDPNCRPATISDRAGYLTRLRGILRRSDVAKVSRDDLAYLAPGRTIDEAARDLREAGARVVLVTDGPHPVRIVSAEAETVLPVLPMPVVDTIGAGDAFGGGFLARWTELGLGRADLADRGRLEEAVRFAILVAGLTCGRAGADPPRRDEVARAATAGVARLG